MQMTMRADFLKNLIAMTFTKLKIDTFNEILESENLENHYSGT